MRKTIALLCLILLALALPVHVAIISPDAPSISVGIQEAQATQAWESCCMENFSFGCCLMAIWEEIFEGDW